MEKYKSAEPQIKKTGICVYIEAEPRKLHSQRRRKRGTMSIVPSVLAGNAKPEALPQI